MRRLKSRGDIGQAIDNCGGRDFLYEKVLSKHWISDNETEERLC